MKFWDSSAIIPLCLEEPQSEVVRAILEQDNSIAVWWGSYTECSSAFARLLRDGYMTTEEEEQAREILSSLSLVWTEIEPSEDIRDVSGRLLLNHALRAADSLQLSAAIIWADKKPKGRHFVCLDIKLREAARKEGFSLLPERIGRKPS